MAGRGRPTTSELPTLGSSRLSFDEAPRGPFWAPRTLILGFVAGVLTQVLLGIVVVAVPALTSLVLHQSGTLLGPMVWCELARSFIVSWWVLARWRTRRGGVLDRLPAVAHAAVYGAACAAFIGAVGVANGSRPSATVVEVVVVIFGTALAGALIPCRARDRQQTSRS